MSEINKPTDLESLTRYLQRKSIDCTSAKPVEGGTANYVFRLLDQNGNSTILKHAEPYVASSGGSIPFPLDRMDFEARAINAVRQIMPTASVVQVPEIVSYDQDAKVLIMSDGGDTTLKKAYSTRRDVDIVTIGRSLGEWLATLHQSTQETDIGEGGNPTGKAIACWPYTHLEQVAGQYGLDVEFCKHISASYSPGIMKADDCVCHGDIWPGNVLLDADSRLTVVDWEMCRRGRGDLDVGQFAAEAYLLDRFCGGKGLLQSFLQGYRSKRESFGDETVGNRDLARLMVVRMGVHLAYWPARVKWAEEEETKKIIELGHELMRRGNTADMDWLCDSILQALFKR
ncbi:MAG: hypothetical protein Q9220_006203 [cf. Caloplaca sp. 1 TL-2023]